MGNLRNKYTDEEWQILEDKIEFDKKNGKPNDLLISLGLYNKDVEFLKNLKSKLTGLYSDYELSLIDDWIKFKSIKYEK
jgi:hypothetical protein